MSTNTNTISAPNYIFLLSSNKLKELEFRVQSFSGLGISLGENVRYWQSLTIVRPGDTMVFNEMNLTILVDENLSIINDLYDYLFRIKDYDENTLSSEDWTGTLIVSNNRNNTTKKFTFKDCWIKSFTDLEFTSTESSNTPLTTSITVTFSHYTITDLT